MKRITKTALITVCLLLTASVVSAFAAAGGTSDPLASLSYLTGTFTDAVDRQVEEKLDASDQAIRTGTSGTAGGAVSTWTETRLKEGDVLTGSTGTGVLVLAGSGRVTFTGGAVVDVTTGTTVSSGASLSVNHRYLVAEDTTAAFTVTSKTAVVDYQGPYGFRYSGTTDYNAMAAALKTMHLFQGSFTGYGQGYDLEVAPTRMQALIMFIRVLGEEDAALAWSGNTPFTDIAAGTQAAHYVGYAYEKGYTNGFTATTFRPSQTITAQQYVEFMLRALGYSSNANTDLTSTFDNAVLYGVLTAGERSQLTGSTFLRADLVYVSYYALDVVEASSGQLLSQVLQEKGVFTSAELSAAQAMVTSSRIW